jgi:hypothetical protein
VASHCINISYEIQIKSIPNSTPCPSSINKCFLSDSCNRVEGEGGDLGWEKMIVSTDSRQLIYLAFEKLSTCDHLNICLTLSYDSKRTIQV